MNKITPDHLARSAYIYMRQSTADQLANNPESRRRQYALKGRAETLGWQNVIVIDDDLGRSGGGVSRKGFERLLVAVGEGSAGAVQSQSLRPSSRASFASLRFRASSAALILPSISARFARAIFAFHVHGFVSFTQSENSTPLNAIFEQCSTL
jgi:Resolvase, N terminal domain